MALSSGWEPASVVGGRLLGWHLKCSDLEIVHPRRGAREDDDSPVTLTWPEAYRWADRIGYVVLATHARADHALKLCVRPGVATVL
jgi:hypothetical protein